MQSLNKDCLLVVFKFVLLDLQVAVKRPYYHEKSINQQLFHLAHINKRCRLALLSYTELFKSARHTGCADMEHQVETLDPYRKYFPVCPFILIISCFSLALPTLM
jgi:hypothetical protein